MFTDQEYDQARAEADAVYLAEWKAAQQLPALGEASEAAYAAEQKRCAAWQAAFRDYKTRREAARPTR